jgi:hypothetical protein
MEHDLWRPAFTAAVALGRRAVVGGVIAFPKMSAARAHPEAGGATLSATRSLAQTPRATPCTTRASGRPVDEHRAHVVSPASVEAAALRQVHQAARERSADLRGIGQERTELLCDHLRIAARGRPGERRPGGPFAARFSTAP